MKTSFTFTLVAVGVLAVGGLLYYVGGSTPAIAPAVTETATTSLATTTMPSTDTTAPENVTATSSQAATTTVKATTTTVVTPKLVVVKDTPVTPAPTPVPTPAPTPVTPTPAPTPVVAGISLATVATHKDAASCWSVIEGKVYDLTAYVPKHPGGKSEILAICGKDGSSLFAGQHGGQSKPAQILSGYYLDVVAK